MTDRLPFSRREVEDSIPARFERIVERFPQRVAVVSDGGALTFDALNRLANRLAHLIIRRCGSGSEPITLLLGNEMTTVAAILGVLKAGKAYTALDASDPIARNRYYQEDLGARLLICDDANAAIAQKVVPATDALINLDMLDADLPEKNPNCVIEPHSLAGVYYTSGTSGAPKGVMRSHRFFMHRFWIESNDYTIGPADRTALIHAFSFGASVTDLFNALLNGGSLHLFNVKERGIAPLIPWLKAEAITFFHPPVALFQQFLNLLTEEDFFPHLRQLTPSGRLFTHQVKQVRRHLPQACVLIQRLASTETGMITRLRITGRTELRGKVVPVGYAVADCEIIIVDDDGNRLEPGSVGTIVAKSRYLAAGYWRRPEMTQAAFMADAEVEGRTIFRMGDLGRMRADGCLELVGRSGSRVKIRGYRIELREVEAALVASDGVKAAAVVAQTAAAGAERLVAYVVAPGLTITALRNALAETLPDFMIPARFVFLDKLPLTKRDKLDVAALPAPGRERPPLTAAYVAPQAGVEQRLADIWSTTLNIEPVGVNDSFFELGGNSLLAADMIAAVRSELQIEIALRTIFDAPTIAAFAAAVAQPREKGTAQETTDLERALRRLGVT